MLKTLNQIWIGYTSLFKKRLALLPRIEIEVADLRKEICDNCDVQSVKFGIDYCDSGKGGCGCIGIAKRQCMDCHCPLNKWHNHI